MTNEKGGLLGKQVEIIAKDDATQQEQRSATTTT